MSSNRFPPRLRAAVLLASATLVAAVGTIQPAVARPEGKPASGPENGRIAFVSGRDGQAEIYAMNPDGSGPVNLTNSLADDINPAWSPDGTEIVFVSNRDGGNSDLWEMNADGSDPHQLTADEWVDSWPSFSPDGKHVVFGSNRDFEHDTDQQLYVMDADGSNVKRLTNDGSLDDEASYSPDGSRIVFMSFRDGQPEIYTMNADGSHQTNITDNDAYDQHPVWSPDGKTIAFETNRDEDQEIYTVNPDGTDPVNFTRSHSTREDYPEFSPDGTKILFTSTAGALPGSRPADLPFPDDRVWVANFPLGGNAAPLEADRANQPAWGTAPHTIDVGLADPPDLGPLPMESGKRLAYRVTNLGTEDALDVKVVATLPHLLQFRHSRICTAAGTAVTCELGSLSPGQTVSVGFRVHIRRLAKRLDGKVVHVDVAVTTSGHDNVPGNDHQTQQVTVFRPLHQRSARR